MLVVVVKVRKTAKKNLRCDILGMGDSLEVISRAVIEKLQTKRSRVGREREVYTLYVGRPARDTRSVSRIHRNPRSNLQCVCLGPSIEVSWHGFYFLYV